MARFENDAKLGFFPTPETMTEKIANRLAFEGPTRLFDPCCGEGVALRTIQEIAPPSSISYGIEIDKARAYQAESHLDKVIASAYSICRIDKGSMQFLWLNPPYDNRAGQGGDESRTELRFLQDTSKFVAPAGVLVFIIPRTTLSKETVRALELRYTNLGLYQFDPDEYEAYQQVVVFGTRRVKLLESLKLLTDEEIEARNLLLAAGSDPAVPVPYLDEMDGRTWSVPAYNAEQEIEFRGHVQDEKELLADLAKSDAFAVAESMLSGGMVDVKLKRPLLPFRRTHYATLIAAGVLNGAVGVGDDRHMVIGVSRKVTKREYTQDEDGKEIVVDTDDFITLVRTIEPDGTIRDLQ